MSDLGLVLVLAAIVSGGARNVLGGLVISIGSNILLLASCAIV